MNNAFVVFEILRFLAYSLLVMADLKKPKTTPDFLILNKVLISA